MTEKTCVATVNANTAVADRMRQIDGIAVTAPSPRSNAASTACAARRAFVFQKIGYPRRCTLFCALSIAVKLQPPAPVGTFRHLASQQLTENRRGCAVDCRAPAALKPCRMPTMLRDRDRTALLFLPRSLCHRFREPVGSFVCQRRTRGSPPRTAPSGHAWRSLAGCASRVAPH